MSTLALNAILRVRDEAPEEERLALANESIRWYLRARSVLELNETQNTEMTSWIDYVGSSVNRTFEMLEEFGVLTPDVLTFDTKGLSGQGWLAPVCLAHGHIEHFTEDNKFRCLFLHLDPKTVAVSIDRPDDLKDYEVRLEILSLSFLWDMEDDEFENLDEFRQYVLERWDPPWRVQIGQTMGLDFDEKLLLRFPEIDSDSEIDGSEGCFIRGEYEDGLEISSLISFSLLAKASSAEEAYFFTKSIAPRIFFHLGDGDPLAVDEVRVLSVDRVKFDPGFGE